MYSMSETRLRAEDDKNRQTQKLLNFTALVDQLGKCRTNGASSDQAERCYQEGLDAIFELKSHSTRKLASASNGTKLSPDEAAMDVEQSRGGAADANQARHLQLAQLRYEAQYFYNQVSKVKRTNDEMESYLRSLGLDGMNLAQARLELRERMRLEKELASVQSLAAEAKQRKLLEEAKLGDFNNRLKTFVEAAKPMIEYFHDRPAPSSTPSPSLANSMAAESNASQRNERAKQAQSIIFTTKHFPTPLYILYQTLQTFVESYRKSEKMSVRIVKLDDDMATQSLDKYPYCIQWCINIDWKENDGSVKYQALLLRFEFLSSLQLVLLSSFLVHSTNNNNNNRTTKSTAMASINNDGSLETWANGNLVHLANFLDQLVPGDSGELFPTSSTAFCAPDEILRALYAEKGRWFDWVQVLCGFAPIPPSTLTLSERVNYAPLSPMVNYIRDKLIRDISQAGQIDPIQIMEKQEIEEIEVVEEVGGDVPIDVVLDELETLEGDDEAAANPLKGDFDEIATETDGEANKSLIIDDNSMNVEEAKPEEILDDAGMLSLKISGTGVSLVLNLFRMIQDLFRRKRLAGQI